MEKEKVQVFLIHGGMTFKSKEDFIVYLKERPISIEEYQSWSGTYLDDSLGDNFQIIRPKMSLKEFANYDEWKIHFERYFSFLDDNIVLIGNSLGGIFLAKYLSENNFPKRILSLYLIAPPFDNTLQGEDLVGGFELMDDLSIMEKNCKKITLMFSKDDDIIPISHAGKYASKLKSAEIKMYESKNGHFRISEFPEIVEMIRIDAKSV